MNLVEKILARASGKRSVQPGEVVIADVDRLIMHDLSGYLTSQVFEEKVKLPVRYPDRVVMVFDHHFAPATERQADVLQANRAWARRHGINLIDCGNGNIHNVVMQRGLISPGMVVVGSDSHTPVHGAVGAFAAALGNDSHAGTVLPYGKAWFKVPETTRVTLSGAPLPGSTARDVALWLVGELGEGSMIYSSLEFAGPYIKGLQFWDRWLFPLLTVDLGAKCAYIEPDEVTAAFARSLNRVPLDRLERSDGDGAEPASVCEYDVSAIVPQVACPPTVGNVHPVSKIAGQPVQWAELGGHGGGRLDDIRTAARLLRGRHVHPQTRFNIVPANRQVFSCALEEGLVATLHDAGATWFPPSTGSNQAVNMGAMSADESMISTHARNFPGRNGSPKAQMYLASAATVTASAISGTITDATELADRQPG